MQVCHSRFPIEIKSWIFGTGFWWEWCS